MLSPEQVRQKSLITAIKTPYQPNGRIDFSAFDRLMKRQILHQVDGVIVGGTTGEGHLMDWEEHIELITYSIQQYSKDLLIVGNTGSNNTKESMLATEEGFKAGMHAALLINPYYGKTSARGIVEHLKRSLQFGPGIIYNVPMRTAQDIPVNVMEEVAKHPNFIGVKECMGNERIAEYFTKGIYCWSGNDDQSFAAKHQHKALGLISTSANAIPSWMRKLMDVKEEKLSQTLQPLFQWMFCEPNPIPLNSCLADLRLVQPVFRLPYVPLPFEVRQKGLALLKDLLPAEVDLSWQALPDSDFKLV